MRGKDSSAFIWNSELFIFFFNSKMPLPPYMSFISRVVTALLSSLRFNNGCLLQRPGGIDWKCVHGHRLLTKRLSWGLGDGSVSKLLVMRIWEPEPDRTPWAPCGWVVLGMCPQSQLCGNRDRKSSVARYLVNLFESVGSRSREILYKTLKWGTIEEKPVNLGPPHVPPPQHHIFTDV